MTIPLISYHGGHSGQFCDHAKEGSLREVVKAYVEKGFKAFGITEHQPRNKEKFLYPEEKAKGRTCEDLFKIFAAYVKEARFLQKEFADRADILVGFETEVCDQDAFELIESLRKEYQTDYVVGSVHHVAGIPIDFDLATYNSAVEKAGSLESLYLQYYDAQYELIQRIKPEIIGHMDLIKLFSPDFVLTQNILNAIKRNIKSAVQYGCIFEVNSRAFYKNFTEPYPSIAVLKVIKEEGGSITLGDDSHGAEQVGLNYNRAVEAIKIVFDEVAGLRKKNNGVLEKFKIKL